MKRTKKNFPFLPHLFVKYVQSFMESMHLINPKKSVLVAVSGGVDSLALMHLLFDIFGKKLRVLHINHGTRAANIDEEQSVLKYAEKLGLEVDVVKLSLNINQSNFEATARNLRAHIYKQYIQKKFWVYTAHHLDDSFEWSMIQSFRQSSLASTLGIPVYNKGLARPFMCVSKSQIKSYARSKKINWAEDESNRDIRFERNFFRQALTKTIHNRYPQYLAHYVARQNELAQKLGVHRSLKLQDEEIKKSKMLEKREFSGAVVLKSSNFSFHKNHIKEWIHFFSKKERGEIDREVDKLILAHKKIIENKNEIKMKGPVSFSGGVKIFILRHYLLFCNDLHLEHYRKLDQQLLKLLMKPQGVFKIRKHCRKVKKKRVFFPYLCFLPQSERGKSSKLVHPLFPMSGQWLKDHQIPYSFYPLLNKRQDLNIINNASLLDSSLLDL